MATLKSFIAASHLPASLIRAVVRQLGGWESFTESAPDIARYGIDGGFGGFIYTDETVAFFRKNREAIVNLAKDQADDLGVGVLEMISNFNCLRGDCTIDEIGETLFGRTPDDQIANALAWYAGEEVARSYVDFIES